MAKSADTSFRLIAEQKRLLSRERLAQAAREADQQGISLESVISEAGDLDPESLERVLKTRERHGRTCKGCGERTYLLPGQTPTNTPCEACGGELLATPDDKQRAAAGPPSAGPASGRSQPPSGRPSGPPSDRPGGPPSGRPGGPRPGQPGGPPNGRPGGPPNGRPGGPPSRPGGPRPGPRPPAPAGAPPSGQRSPAPGAAPAAGAGTGRLIGGAPTSSIGQDAARAAAEEASRGSLLEGVTFSGDTVTPEEVAAAAAAAEAGAQGAADDDLSFRSGAYDSEEMAAARASAMAEPEPEGFPGAAPIGGIPTGGILASTGATAAAGFGHAPGAPPDEPAADDQRTITYPAPEMPGASPTVGPTVVAGPSGTPRDLRQAGGNFGYEPPSEEEAEAVPPRGRLGLPGTFAPSSPGGDHGDLGETEVGEAPYEEGADDDARFRPPAEHLARVGAAEERGPVPPLRTELPKILKLPLNPSGLAFIAMGATLVFLIGHAPILMKGAVIALALYPTTYMIRVMRSAMVGREELPDWPDFDFGEIGGNGLRMLACIVASFLPIVLGFCLFGAVAKALSSGGAPQAWKTIGEQAHMSAGTEPNVPNGADAKDVTFYAAGKTDQEVHTGEGRWTILGLIAKSDADDTGMKQAIDDMPSAGFGISIQYAHQIYDLDRVGQALGRDVRVVAAFADPDQRIIDSKFPWLAMPSEGEQETPEEPSPEEALLNRGKARADLEKAVDFAARSKGGRARQASGADELKVTQVVRTAGWTFPEPFEKVRRVPCVYVLDPQGQVRREYATGVYDEKLYADVRSLMRGGRGDESAESLPQSVKPTGGVLGALGSIASGGAMLLAGLLLLVLVVAGLFYWPMANILMGVFDSPSTPFLYPAGFRAMAVAWKDYLALSGLLIGLSFLGGLWTWLGGWLLAFLPSLLKGILTEGVGACVAFYASVVSSYAIGRYYYANQEAIGWLTR
ncbi:MAG: DUF4013 domain-containing protein [Planctomycetota bacterium]